MSNHLMPGISGVPVIDASKFLSKANEGAEIPRDVIDQIADAAATWGFFQLVNHGVDNKLLEDHFEATKRFFALPQSVKTTAQRTADNGLGYFSEEYTKQKLDIKQGFDFRLNLHRALPDDHPDNYDPQGINRWPQGQPEFKEINERYITEVTRLSFRLLEVFALGLGLRPTALHHLFKPHHSSVLRLNYYPVTPDAEPGSLGISDHKDPGFLTVLVQDYKVPGLQVLREDEWHLVEPLPGALTINVGDMAQVVSNDKFKASNHRVLRSTTRDRYSRAYFFNPSPAAEVGDALPHYRPFTWKEFYLARIADNYAAQQRDDIQIDWYRVTGAVPATGP